MAHVMLGLFHLKVWGGGGGGRRNGRFFEGGGGVGPNSELVYTIRVYMISDPGGGRGVSNF